MFYTEKTWSSLIQSIRRNSSTKERRNESNAIDSLNLQENKQKYGIFFPVELAGMFGEINQLWQQNTLQMDTDAIGKTLWCFCCTISAPCAHRHLRMAKHRRDGQTHDGDAWTVSGGTAAEEYCGQRRLSRLSAFFRAGSTRRLHPTHPVFTMSSPTAQSCLRETSNREQNTVTFA